MFIFTGPGDPSTMIHLESGTGFGISVLPYGASWVSCRVPLADGSLREAILGCATETDYRRHDSYLGATIGRFANRIRRAEFQLGDTAFVLDRNDGEHCLHGGFSGFGRRDWALEELAGDRARFSIVSANGEGGFPGLMTAEVVYFLNRHEMSVTIGFLAAVDRPCPVSLTNHAYFNLNGEDSKADGHSLRLASDRFLPIDRDGVPTGELADVAGTPFDFRQRRRFIPDSLAHPQLVLNRGYNHAYVLGGGESFRSPAAELRSADESLALYVHSTMPALHLYGGNYLAGTPSRGQLPYADYAGIALETEFLPDGPNHPDWLSASPILYPGRVYRHFTKYRFAALGASER